MDSVGFATQPPCGEPVTKRIHAGKNARHLRGSITGVDQPVLSTAKISSVVYM